MVSVWAVRRGSSLSTTSVGRVRVEGQHRLAERGAVGRLPSALAGRQREVPEGDPFEVDDVGSVEHPQLHGEPRRDRERVEVREGRLGQPASTGGQPADLEHAHADPVARDVALEPTDLTQLLDHAVDRRLRELRALGELVEREQLVVVVERAEDAVDPAQDRPAGARRAVPEWPVPLDRLDDLCFGHQPPLPWSCVQHGGAPDAEGRRREVFLGVLSIRGHDITPQPVRHPPPSRPGEPHAPEGGEIPRPGCRLARQRDDRMTRRGQPREK